jgi:pilin isopeptide linkage protein
MNVRKRGLALLMCICMIFTLLPFSVFAEDPVDDGSHTHSEANGVVMDKSVEKTGEDTYTVTLEQYVTGTVTEGKATPIDVVLVLDVSGSMKEGFGNGYTKKIDSLKNAVNKFIDAIAAKNKDSKIAIVKFSGNKSDDVGNTTYTSGGYTYNHTQIVNNLTAVNNNANVTSLKKAVDGLKAYGSTRADFGLEKAQEAFGTTSATDGRQRVVIMFTDGEPNSQSEFDNDVANGAISAANTLKKSSESSGYDAKVYTIGIFKNANVGSDLPDNDSNGRTNRYMHLVSSNYPNATDLSTPGTDGAVKNGYYKVAANADELNKVFTDIGDAVGNPAITLGRTAVLTDVVAGNFTAPANTTDVNVYTADYDGSKFADRADWADITNEVNVAINANDNSVTVSGFDYSANFVTNNKKADGTYGKKLIVEFTIKVDREKTYGGTQPTNAGAKIDLGDETIIEVDNPKVPVAITNGFDCNYTNTKSYEKGVGFTIENEFKAMLVKDGLATKIADNEFKNDFVTITYEVTDKDNNLVGTYTINRNAESGTWTLAENASATTSDAVDTYVYNVTCKVTDAKTTTPNAASVSAEGEMTLTITPLTGLTVSANGYERKYDGQEHGGTVTASDGATIWYKIGENGAWTNTAPTIKNVDDEINGKTIYVKATKDNYSDSEIASYTLKVTPRNVTLTSESATKAYDGTPLTRPDVTIGGDGFVAGEVTNIKATGTVTDVTTTPVTNTIVYDTTNNFKAANYNITKNEGTLTIYKAGDALATIQATKNFDGNPATTPSQFSFVLEGIEGKDTGKSFSGTNDANGKIVISRAYSEEGTYKYKLSEVKGTDTGIVYDGTAYYVQVVVKLNEQTQKYEAEVSYFADADCKEQIAKDTPTFNNTTAPGSLTISKTVSGNAASTTKEFTFIVKLIPNSDTTNNNIIYGNVTNVTVIDDEISFKLKAGDSKTINGLPDGIRYTVQELDSNGYTVSAKVNDDPVQLENNMLEGTIAAGVETKIVFNNHKSYVYPPNPPIMDEIIVEITGNSDSVVYDGTEHSVKGYTVKISDPRYTEADFTFTGKAEASGVNAGTYEMGLKAEQFKNTNARFTNVKFVIKADGVLTITPKELIITAGSKTEYGPTPVTCGEWTVSGLVAGDKVESVKITGIQSVPGSSPNVPSDAVIKNAKGEDVTKNYAIKYVNGTLTMLEVLNKEDHFNYIIGTPEGLSLPTANVTRAEVATIFFRLMTDDARAKFDSLDNNFSDVAKGKWYNRAISTLAKAGIIKGDPAGTYRPGDPITRAEMAAIIARFGDFKDGGKTFSDISGHWAQKYIELAASNGWINGNPDGTFKPNNNITRAETVAMINRVLDRQTKDVSDLLPVSQMTNWSDNMDTSKWYYRDMQEATNNHKAERVGNSIYEKWTEKLPDIDWASYQI